MTLYRPFDPAPRRTAETRGLDAPFPQFFSAARESAERRAYLDDPAIQRLVEFFESKGLAAIKHEDQHGQWYADWLAFQAQHQLYAQLLTPKQFSTTGAEWDLLRYARFLEVFAYFSPAHGYSLQVTFLGLFAILMGSNAALKQEAVAALQNGGLLAFGVSERSHGSDLLANEFTVTQTGPGRLRADGTKYYIGNSNCAAMISILGRKQDPRGAAYSRRAPLVLLALRPQQSKSFRNLRKIGTLGVRAAYVGAFEVLAHELPEPDVIAEGRQAWDAVFGTVTLGKLFLGFGSLGICEHAFEEALAHLNRRILYGKPVLEMPHMRATMAQAYARLTAMKLYAYRALDYVRDGRAADRRYLLYCAVQKARVSTEGVKVIALLSECMGAKGFETDSYLEMALRDGLLIPSLEGSTHINLKLTAQFVPRYFCQFDPELSAPPSMIAGDVSSAENPYLMEARTGVIDSVAFPHFLTAYEALISIPNVRLFAKQAKAFQLLVRACDPNLLTSADALANQQAGQCLAIVAYAQLIAELGARLDLPREMLSAIFHTLVNDFSVAALALAAGPAANAVRPSLFRRMVVAPRTSDADWDFVSRRMRGTGDPPEGG